MQTMTRTQRSGRPGAVVSMLMLAALAACGDISGPDPGREAVATVQVAAASGLYTGVLLVGDTLRLAAIARTDAGEILPGLTASWASLDTTVATISASGVVRALQPGQVRIRATVEGTPGEAILQVVAGGGEAVPVVAEVRVSPTAIVLQQGGSRVLSARAFDADGNEIHGRDVVWTSTAASVAIVTQAGVVLAVGGGYADIRATIDGVTGTATVTVETSVPVVYVIVTPATASEWVGGTKQLRALTIGPTGGDLHGRMVTWHSENPAIATVDANGVVKGIAAGSARIVATSEGVTASATITIYAPPLGTVHGYRVNGRTDLRGAPVYLGTVDWVDGSGITRRVARFVERGSFTIDFVTGRYRQTMEIDLYDAGGFTRIATLTVVDEGSWSYSFSVPGYHLRSDDASLPGVVAQQTGPGELRFTRSVAGSAAISWEWVLDQ